MTVIKLLGVLREAYRRSFLVRFMVIFWGLSLVMAGMLYLDKGWR